MTGRPHTEGAAAEALTPAFARRPTPVPNAAGTWRRATPPTVSALPAAPPSSRHLPALDGVRGCAILMVMLLHFSTDHAPPPDTVASVVWGAFRWGWTGVDLFFVLSGFLITGILADARGGARYFRTFYARRALRIFPLYYGVLAAYFLFAARVVGPAYRVPLAEQAWYWAYLGNFRALPWESSSMIGHFWSLAIEEQFYLLWPLAVFVCTRRQALALCGAGVAGAFAFRLAALLHGASGSLVYHYTFGRVDGLALGAAVALVLRGPDGVARLRRWAPRVAGVAGLALVALLVRARGLTPAAANFQLMSVGYTTIALLFAAAVAGLVAAELGGARAPRGLVRRALASRPLVALGTFSYALYVLHPMLLRVAARAGLAPSAAAVARHPLLLTLGFPAGMLCASLAGAVASWHLYEKHFLALKRRFRYEPAAPVPAAGAEDRRAAA